MKLVSFLFNTIHLTVVFTPIYCFILPVNFVNMVFPYVFLILMMVPQNIGKLIIMNVFLQL